MSDIRRELDFHLDMQTRRYIEEGLDPEAARAKALARMGDLRAVERVSANLDDREPAVKPNPILQTLGQDARYAVRVLKRAPLFTVTALVTLAVGIGATTAIFSVVHAVLLRDLPYPNAGRTMLVFNSYQQTGLEAAAVSPPEFADIRRQSQAFEAFAAIRPQISALSDDCGAAGCEPERVNAYEVSPQLFDVLGVRPRHGRAFTAADGVIGAERVVILSDALWQRRYGRDPAVLGRRISLAGVPRVVVGIMDTGVQFPDEPVGYLEGRADIWIPTGWEDVATGRGNQFLEVLALRRLDVSAGQAEADLQRISEAFKARFPARYAEPHVRWRLGTTSLTEEMLGDVRPGLAVLFGAVGCVLLIACANVANLMLARGASRGREMALRSALGAGRRRLVQQLLVEALVLTTTGTLLGVGVAAAGLPILLALNPGGIPRLDAARIDAPVLLFAAAVALATGVLVGLVPARRQAHANPQTALGGARTGTASPRPRLRGTLVMVEVALAVIVLTGAALLIRSYVALAATPIGVTARNIAVARLSIPRAQYDEDAKVFAFHRAMRDRIAALPGVIDASAVYPLPASDSGWSGSVAVVGRPEAPGTPEPHAEYAVALPGYFRTMGIPLLEGRDFTDADNQTAPEAVVIDTEFARRYFPGRSAIGQRLAVSGDAANGPFQTVIGVVGHVRNKGAREAGGAQLYLAALQEAEQSLFFVGRTSTEASVVLPEIRAAVRAQDPGLPVATLTTMQDVLAALTARDRFNTLLFTMFGGVALAMASIGLYGVLAFLVSQRSREIGIRLALGGRPSGLVRSVLVEGMTLAIAGMAAGLGGAYLLGGWMRGMLFEIEPADPVTYGVIAGVILAVAVAACLLPARRATTVDPMIVLRQD